VEWTTQSKQHAATGNGDGAAGYGNGNGADTYADGAEQTTQLLPAQEAPAIQEPPAAVEASPAQQDDPAPTATAAHPPAPHPHAAPPPQPPAGYEHCPSCGALVATDQRYCLACGVRRGDPRLPFMDAVVFMDAMKQPPDGQAGRPSKKKKRRLSPNAALIAGVGTLLLALGLGVLIGRSGGETSAPQQAAPIVIKGGGEEAETSSANEPTIGGGSSAKAKKKAKAVPPEEAAEAPSEEVLKPTKGVKLPPPTAQVGEKCVKGQAGCNSKGKFDGSFFGE
jgi:hypothetical protein